MAKRQKEDLSILEYRLDVLERRLDSLEKLVNTGKTDNINTELLGMLLSMVKQNIQQPQQQNNTSTPAIKQQEESPQDETITKVSCGETFMFNRRRTLV